MSLKVDKPTLALVPSFLSCLEEGNFRGMQLGFGDLPKETIESDPAAYIALINGTTPFTYKLQDKDYAITDHELLWISDEDRFLGTIALRYDGDPELIEDFAGHIGMAIRPALLNKGYGPRAIKTMYDAIADRFAKCGMDHIFATCDEDNTSSARLIEYFGGELDAKTIDPFGAPSLRYRLKRITAR